MQTAKTACTDAAIFIAPAQPTVQVAISTMTAHLHPAPLQPAPLQV